MEVGEDIKKTTLVLPAGLWERLDEARRRRGRMLLQDAMAQAVTLWLGLPAPSPPTLSAETQRYVDRLIRMLELGGPLAKIVKTTIDGSWEVIQVDPPQGQKGKKSASKAL